MIRLRKFVTIKSFIKAVKQMINKINKPLYSISNLIITFIKKGVNKPKEKHTIRYVPSFFTPYYKLSVNNKKCLS